MGKLVVVNLLEGNLERGFSVLLEIGLDGRRPEIEIRGNLPPAPHISESFSQWQEYFRKKVNPGRSSQESNSQESNSTRAKAIKATTFSSSDAAKKLATDMNSWLNSGNSAEWQKIRDALQQNLSPDEEIRVIIQTGDRNLRRLPWSVWDLFAETYTQAEIALSAPEYKDPRRRSATHKHSKVRILAIMGDSDGIDIEFDRQELERSASKAEIKFLEQPTKRELLEWLGNERGWDILFFAGHSSSQPDGQFGQLDINSHESIRIDELKNTLRTAISQRLQLVIFNSCDGLGLGNQLAELHLPQSILMREEIPDQVAQEFLQHFLTSFASDKSLYASVLSARRKLEDAYNEKYPGISWLPTICQNPAVEPPTWQGFQGIDKEREPFFDPHTVTWRCAYTLTGHSDFVNSVAISPDGQMLASGSVDRTIKLWDLGTGELLYNITGHSSGITCVTFSHDGKTLASSSANPDGTIKLWDPQTGELKGTLKGDDWVVLSVWSIALSPNGQILVSGHQVDSTVKIWNLGTGELLHTLRGHVLGVKTVAFSPNEDIIVSGGWDSNIKIWNPNTGREIRNLNGPGSDPLLGLVPSFFSRNFVHAVAFSPDGTTIASGGEKQPIQLWRVSNGERTLTLTGHSDAVYSVAFSPDGRTLVSGSADRTIKIWDLSTGEPLQTLGHSDTVYAVAFSPDGRTLVSGSKDRTVKVWRLGS
ncbi:MAG: CHAT domain-containing protein [Hormoscilla sp.]